MKQPRQRFRRLRRRRKQGSNRLAEQTEFAKAEAREVDRRERERTGRLRRQRVKVEGLRRPTRTLAAIEAGVARLIEVVVRELRRVLTPVVSAIGSVVSAIGSVVSWIAPPIVNGLLLVFGLALLALGAVADAAQAIVGGAVRGVRTLGRTVGGALERAVTPARALAFVVIAVAGLLAASQFADYRGVAVSAPQYAGEVGTIADAPLTDLETTGSAHLYLGVPLALAVIVLAILALRGRPRLGLLIGAIGLAGIATTLLIDLPQGLDAGRAGISYEGSEARLAEGFWAQLSACAALLVCGPLLGRYAHLAAAAPGPAGRPAGSDEDPEDAEETVIRAPRRFRRSRLRRRFRRRRFRSTGMEAGT
jgi:hypothetical protein